MSAWWLLLLSQVTLAAPVEDGTSTRYALVAGANDGGPDRVRLRYAKSDAAAMLNVLNELGGVPATQSILVQEPGRYELLEALDELERMVESHEGGRSEVVFYYSGHADDQGLLLHDTRVTWKELRTQLDGIDADVRIAILDSCSSGALLRSKGGTPVAPFLVDTSTQVSGHAYLTSSSADEAAQEADRINGSFFTHHLVSGMRGAADSTQDHRVTLNEAYHYAYTQTLASTENTQNGAQHANYDIQLSGAGDLVMTDLSVMNAGIVLAADLGGRLFVRDRQGTLVAELVKPVGNPMELGLVDGRYQLRLETNDRLYERTLELAPGDHTEITVDSFKPLQRMVATARGGESSKLRHVPFVGAIAPGLGAGGDDVSAGFAVGLTSTHVGAIEHGSVALVGNSARQDASGGLTAIAYNVVGGDSHGGMFAVGTNIIGGNSHGFQAAVGPNITAHDVRGIQSSVAGNFAGGEVDAGQLAAGINVAPHTLQGLQLAAGVNVVGGWADAAQLAAGGNFARGDLRGVQMAAGINVVGGDLRGVQLAAGVNVAKGVAGTQMACVNTAKKLSGLQLGIVNVAGKNDGLQIGLINVGAGGDGDGIGLLTFQRGGRHRAEVYTSDVAAINAGFQLGGKRLYTVFGGGYGPRDELDFAWFGLGMGWHLALDPVWFEAEALVGTPVVGRTVYGASMMNQYRVKAGVRVVEHLNPYVAFNMMHYQRLGGAVVEPGGLFAPDLPDDTTFAFWPGVAAGLVF